MSHRDRGQITPLALFGLIVLLGAVALVVDAGVFFVTQRQLQTAVDAAALEGAWYKPACDSNSLTTGTKLCTDIAPGLPALPPSWDCTKNPPADCVAFAVLQNNLGFVGRLCAGLPTAPKSAVTAYAGSGLREYSVTVTCTAPYWFANIFPDMPTMEITAQAAATVGYPNITKTDVSSIPTGLTPNLMSRLVPYPNS